MNRNISVRLPRALQRNDMSPLSKAPRGRGATSRRLTLLCGFAAIAVSACAPTAPPVVVVNPPSSAPRADVNQPRRPIGLPDSRTPNLAEMQELRAGPRRDAAAETDRLRASAMRDSALAYGAQGGLAWGSREINQMLERQAPNLDRTFDFNRLMIRQPGGVSVLPPVISEGRDTYEQADAGRTIRVADRYYEIVEQSRFAPTAPLWHEYLVRIFETPRTPPSELLPQDSNDRDLWRRYVAEGWAEGEKQAREIFRADLARLERDYTGMVRYAEMLQRGQVSSPLVANQTLGVTGSGQNMRVNDTVHRITRDPRLNVREGRDWKALSSPMDPTTAATPPGDTPGTRDR